MIGKTLLDKSGITEFFGGEINVKDIKPLPIYVDRTDWINFKSDLDRLEKAPAQVDIYLKKHGLEHVEDLKDYILNNDIRDGNLNIEKFNGTISQSNSSLGKYLTSLNGAKAGMDSYAGSLITATAKTVALQAATMALNTAIYMGISFIISEAISVISAYVTASSRLQKSAKNLSSQFFQQFKYYI